MNAVLIEDYDPLWPERFETLRARIAPVLQEVASAIEHVGSTAVPGLAAKPIIDIDVLLRAEQDLPVAIARLASAGYQRRGSESRRWKLRSRLVAMQRLQFLDNAPGEGEKLKRLLCCDIACSTPSVNRHIAKVSHPIQEFKRTLINGPDDLAEGGVTRASTARGAAGDRGRL